MAKPEISEQTLQRTALIVVCLGAFINPLMLSAVNVAIPVIARELRTDAIVTSWIPMAYLLASAAFLLPFGRLGDLRGRKRMFLWGMATLTAASIFAALAPSPLMLLLCRVLQGVGAAMLFGTGIAILSSVFPREKRGRVLGLSVSSIYLGLTCGPFLGGWITHQFGWRMVFVFHVPVALLVIAMALINLKGKEWRGAAGEPFDLPGALIYGVSISALMCGFSILPAWYGFALIILSGLGLWGFIRYEKNQEHPVFNVKLFFDNRVFTYSCLASLIMYAATFSITFLMSLYLQNIRGLAPQVAGMLMMAQPLMMTLFSPLAGKMSDRREPRLLASSGMGLTALGLATLALATPQTPTMFIVSILIAVGVGFSLFSSPNANAIMSSVEAKHLGAASGSVATMRVLGQVLSMGVVTLTFAVILGPVQIAPEHHDRLLISINASFGVAALLCLAGVYFSIKRGNLRN